MLRERLGTLDAGALAAADLEPLFREKPALHRYPGAMAERVHDLAAHIAGPTTTEMPPRVWTDAKNTEPLRANLEALPGFGDMKVNSLGSVLAKRFKVRAAKGLAARPPDARGRRLPAGAADYQAAKRAHKAALAKARAPQ